MKILVADDDRVISTMLCGVLRQAGHKPTPALDAMQALMFAMRAPLPDLVLLDINMPGGTGLETLKRLKQSAKTAHIPVVVITGSTTPDIEAQARALGAEEFLSKPVDPEALLEVVNSLA